MAVGAEAWSKRRGKEDAQGYTHPVKKEPVGGSYGFTSLWGVLADTRGLDEVGHYLKEIIIYTKITHWWRMLVSGRTRRFRTLPSKEPLWKLIPPFPYSAVNREDLDLEKGKGTQYLWVGPQGAWVTALACTGNFLKFYAGLYCFNNNKINIYTHTHTHRGKLCVKLFL